MSASVRYGPKDADLHKQRSNDHLDSPPEGVDEQDWQRRMRAHLARHDLDAKLPKPKLEPEPVKVPPGTDAWLAQAKTAVKRLGEAVELLIEEEAMSKGELATLMGMAPQSLSDRLKGRTEFSLAEGLFLERHFGVKLVKLLELP